MLLKMDWGRNDNVPGLVIGCLLQFSKAGSKWREPLCRTTYIEGMRINKEVWLAEYIQICCPSSTLI